MLFCVLHNISESLCTQAFNWRSFDSSLNLAIDVLGWEIMKILIPLDIGLTLFFRLTIPDTEKQFIIIF